MRESNFTNASNLDGFTEAEITAIQVCYSITGSVGLIENIGVIMVILCKRIMLEFPSNWFVLSLAIADASHCLGGIFFAITIEKIDQKPLPKLEEIDSIYIVYGIIIQFSLLSSTGNLFLLTFNRFLSVYNSLRYPAYMTTSRAKCLVWVPWIIAVLIIAIFGYSTKAGIKNATYLTTTLYTVLISSITVLNIYMVRKAREKRRNDVRQEDTFSSPRGKSHEYNRQV